MNARSLNSTQPNRLIKPLGVAALVIAFGISFLLGTEGFQTYLSKERRLIEAGEVLAKSLRSYRDASPGSAKDFPTDLTDLLHDPRMLADKGYLTTLPVDPLTQKQSWGVVRNKLNQVIGAHSLSNESPTIYAKLLSFKRGDHYADWKFMAD